MRNVAVAAFAVSILASAGQPAAIASERILIKQNANASFRNVAAQLKAGMPAGNYERKCMVMSCGTTWCYNVRR